MILRRVMEHVKDQNWTAVGIDFLIVVVGVFVGLQVQDWNDARKERIEERAIMNRLHAETRALLDLVGAEHGAQKALGDALMSANPVLFAQEPARELTVTECESITGSHVYRLGSDELPVLDEILETGRFDLLSSESVKIQLRSYVVFRETERSAHEERTNELFRLHNRYPEMIEITRKPREEGYPGRWDALAGEGFRWVVHCDVEKMRESVGFLNDYVDNLARTNSTIRAYEKRIDILTKLEATLARELSVDVTAN